MTVVTKIFTDTGVTDTLTCGVGDAFTYQITPSANFNGRLVLQRVRGNGAIEVRAVFAAGQTIDESIIEMVSSGGGYQFACEKGLHDVALTGYVSVTLTKLAATPTTEDTLYAPYSLISDVELLTTRVAILESLPTGITPQVADHLEWTVQPRDVNIAEAIFPSVVVTIKDSIDQTMSADNTSVVTISILTGVGSVSNATEVVVNGVATFTGLLLNNAQSGVVLRASCTGLNDIDSDSFDVAPTVVAQVASQLVFVTQPSTIINNRDISPSVVVEVQDSHGDNVVGDTSIVTLTIQTGSGSIFGNTAVCVDGVATFNNLTLDTAQTGVTLHAARSGLTAVNSSSFSVLATPTDEIRVATEFYRPMPQPHEDWTPTYTTSLSYKMCPGEMMPFWFRVKTGSAAITLALGGADAAKYTAVFYKPFGQVVDNSTAFNRASNSTSPTGTYYDPLNPIATGASNFTAEVADTYEFIFCTLTCKSNTTTGNHSLSFTFGTDTVTATIHAWDITLPAYPHVPMLLQMEPTSAQWGIRQSRNVNDQADQILCGNNVTDFMTSFRMTNYKNGLANLAVSAGLLNIDNGGTGSYRSMFLDRMPAGAIKFWMANPANSPTVQTLAYAQAAEATIAAESLTNMWLYVYDEPSGSAAWTIIKTTLDNWLSGSPSTKCMVTATRGSAIANGVNPASYPNLVLCPVIDNVASTMSSYVDASTGFYSSCQGQCQGTQNSNTTPYPDQGYADLARIDYPVYRHYAFLLLPLRSTFSDKIIFTLHYHAGITWQDVPSSVGVYTDVSKNSWLSARRFGVMGDGTLMYPKIPGYKPHTGIAAFASNSRTAVPSIRLLYLNHASYMADLFKKYLTDNAVHIADNLVTNTNTFNTNYGNYETYRTQVGDALEAASTITPPTATKLGYTVQPSNAVIATNISPAVKVAVQDANGGTMTASTATVVMTKLSGTGSLSGTTSVAAVAGIATFSDLKLSAASDVVLRASSGALTVADSTSFTVSSTSSVTDLNDITSLADWWRADTVTLTGSDITQWTNKKTAATYHLTSTTNQSKPSILSAVSGINNQDAGQFLKANGDASNKYISTRATATWILIVFRVSDASVDSGIVSSWDKFGDFALKAAAGGKLLNLNVAGDGVGSFTAGTTNIDTSWHWALMKIAHGGTHKVYLDGSSTAEISTASGDSAVESIRIGGFLSNVTTGDGSGASLLYGNVDIADVAVFDNNFSDTVDFESIRGYINTRYGLIHGS